MDRIAEIIAGGTRIMLLKNRIGLILWILLLFPLAAFGAANNLEPINILEPKALKGDSEAQYQMGVHCARGTQGRQDFAKAEQWFCLSAEQGNANGMYGLGWILDRRAETKADEIEVAKLYRLSADKGVQGAQYCLALYILNKKADLSRDIDAAVDLLKKSAAQNNLLANFLLVEMAHKKQCDPETGARSLQYFRDWAKKGNALAQYKMGQINEHGYLVSQDNSKAMFWYKKAVSKGNNMAHVRIGHFYEYGLSVTENFEKARQSYVTAVKTGNSEANWNIAQLYEKGKGVIKSDETAAKYYLKAAKKGNLKSMTDYGIMLTEGRGVKRNDSEAAIWLGKAAAWGDADAQYCLGKMYLEDRIKITPEKKDQVEKWIRIAKGKPRSPKKIRYRMAMHWFEKAAAQGHAEAAREFKRANDLTGWFELVFGIIALPFSIAGFIRPHIFAKNRNQFAARYIGAPLTFLLGIVMIIEGIRSLGLLQ